MLQIEKTIPAWDVKKVTQKSEVIRPAKKDGKTVHFANLMDFCHLKNAELAKMQEAICAPRGQRQ